MKKRSNRKKETVIGVNDIGSRVRKCMLQVPAWEGQENLLSWKTIDVAHTRVNWPEINLVYVLWQLKQVVCIAYIDNLVALSFPSRPSQFLEETPCARGRQIAVATARDIWKWQMASIRKKLRSKLNIVILTNDWNERNLSHDIRHDMKCFCNTLYRINKRRCISIIHFKHVLYASIVPFNKHSIGKHLVFVTRLFPFDS